MSDTWDDTPRSARPNSSEKKLYQRMWFRVTAGTIAAALVIFAIVWNFVIPNSVESAGNQKEQGLIAATKTAEIELATCINNTQAVVGAANSNTAAIEKAITTVAADTSGTYTLTTTAGRNALFALAFPNTNGITDAYMRAMEQIVGCQKDFGGDQNAVQARVADFNTWLTGSWTSRHFASGFPNTHLTFTDPANGQTYHGQDALDHISTVILNSGAAQAYHTGTYNPGDPFASSTDSPSAAASASSNH